jgi:ligand-binding SRPBCC domain-containing protein
MTDRVRYALPLGRLGDAVHAVAIRTLLNAIFDYRFDRIRALHPDRSNGPVGAAGETGREAA